MLQKIKKLFLLILFVVILGIAGTIDSQATQTQEEKQTQIQECMQQANINKISKQ